MTTTPPAWHIDPQDPSRLRWWDGQQWTEHVAPVMPPASFQPYRPAEGLKVTAIALAIGMTVIEVLLALVAQPSLNQIQDAVAEGRSGVDVFTPWDLIGLLQFPVQIAAYVVTCLWLWRVRANAEALNPQAPHKRRKGWVWGAWICPVVNFWFPYQIVRDIARAGRPSGAEGIGLGWWWATFLVWDVLSNVLGRISFSGITDPDGFGDAAQAIPPIQAVCAVGAVISIVLWVRIIRRIAADQELRSHG